MRSFIMVDCLKPGQIVAESIYENRGNHLLLSEGITLTPGIIARLKDRCISAVSVVDTFGSLTPEEVKLETGRVEMAGRLSTFANDFYGTGAPSLEPVQQAVDVVFDQLASDNRVLVYLQQVSIHDNYIFAHSVDVAIYAVLLGLSYGMSKEDISILGTGALLHDIGKIGVDRSLLQKPASLTELEYEAMKQHPDIGYKHLDKIESLDERIRRIALEHHERIDGSGYPNALFGDSIHLFSKITSICDVYDALVSERSYKRAYRPDQAAAMLRATKNLDSRLVEALLARLAVYPPGIKVRLNNGAVGAIVKSINTANPVVVLLISQDNENTLHGGKIEVVELTEGLQVVDIVEEPEFKQLLAASQL